MSISDNKKEDYKEYIYIRIPKSEYNKIILGEKKITKEDIKAYRINYELKQSEKIAYAKRATKIKHKKTLIKIYNALEAYFLSLFKEEKNLTAYKLAKLANINYRTAKKFYTDYNLKDRIKELNKNPQTALKTLKEEIFINFN